MPDPSNINLLREVCGREEITLAVQNAPKKTKESHNWLSAKGKRKNSTHRQTQTHRHTDTVRRNRESLCKTLLPRANPAQIYFLCVPKWASHFRLTK